MSKNPFINHSDYTPNLKRNSYDLSFQNNLSVKIGAEVPILCLEAYPGDSFRVKIGSFLRAFPTVFPVQTPIRQTIHLFKVYNRTLQDNWMDFIYNNRTDVTPPYIGTGVDFRPGTLADYLGVPVSYYGKPQSLNAFIPYDTRYDWNSLRRAALTGYSDFETALNEFSDSGFQILPVELITRDFERYFNRSSLGLINQIFLRLSSNGTALGSNCGLHVFVFRFTRGGIINPAGSFELPQVMASYTGNDTDAVEARFPVDFSSIPADPDGIFQYKIFAVFIPASTGYLLNDFSYTFDYSVGADVDDVAFNPFIDDIHISALPFRAYEDIHNGFYRDIMNDPFYINGQQQFNRYVTNKGDGKDNTRYELFYRNWEKDFLTSAYPSPQQGLAPLVGITSRGNMHIERPDGTIKEVESVLSDDGQHIDSFKMDAEIAGDPAILATAMEVASSGISINDLRQVGALQRWLEANMRRGLRYRDQVLAHTGVKIDYDELDMPEFIGGYSRVVNTSQINNTSAQGDAPLGSFGGQLSFFNSMDHSVSTYFKEHGFLMAIMTIVPVPAYSQLLPKMFLKDNSLSYYSPEFAKIGMQPISYKEVCPVQVVNENSGKTLNDTFGYQRPWYDLISKTDEVHGQMRTTMRDFIMNRTFDGVPELGPDFLHVDPKQVNQVFAVQDPSEDTFFGQVVFDIQKKTSIPRSGIPQLNA